MSNSSTISKLLTNDQPSNLIVCYAPAMITTNGVWQGDNPLDYSLPLFIVQLIMVVVTTRTLIYILKPLRQPHVIAEVLGGILLGPSVLGKFDKFANTIFPLRSVMVLETMANIGLLYFLFLVGVKMDLNVIKKTGKKAITIAIGGMILPFVIGCTFSLFMVGQSQESTHHHHPTYVLFLGVALAVTTFPVLASILAELKLINTNMGQIAMSSALVNDVCVWILLSVAIALADINASSLTSLWVILSCFFFVIFCIYIVRPAIIWLMKQTQEGEPINDFHICLILTGVMILGFVTNAMGTHSLFGAFVFGLVIPNGPLGTTLIERLEDFVSGLLLPLFFAISGLKTDISKVPDVGTWMNLLVVILLSCIAKVAGTTMISYFHNMPLREGMTLGLLMNSKGLVEMIVLNVGKDQKVLDDALFSIMVVASLFITAIITPLVTTIYKPERKFAAYKRTIQSTKPNTELRLLTCVHTPKNVSTMINFLDVSYSAKKSRLHVFVLHLVELTGRASSMLIEHTSRRQGGGQSVNRTQAQSEHIIAAFETYEHQAHNVLVNPLTTISPYSSMHEDICNVAEDKRVAFIILPFHKQQIVDGAMETTNPTFRVINQNVLANSPCSIGILVDRGLNGSVRMGGPNLVTSKSVTVIFFGGPDDREALSYALRMSQHSGIYVTVTRFISMSDQPKRGQVPQTYHPNNSNSLTVIIDVDQQREFDEECINEFRTKTGDNQRVTFQEKLVNNAEETVRAIRGMQNKYDLYIVGRGQGITTPLTAGLTEWTECPELGAIGNLLASSDISLTTSVLVVQQYVGLGQSHGIPDSPTNDAHFDFHDMMGEFRMGHKF